MIHHCGVKCETNSAEDSEIAVLDDQFREAASQLFELIDDVTMPGVPAQLAYPYFAWPPNWYARASRTTSGD